MGKKRKRIKINSKYFLYFAFILFILTLFITLFDFSIKPSKELVAIVDKINPSPTPVPVPTAAELASSVIPDNGYQTGLAWGDVGIRLVESGAIDLDKFKDNYDDPFYQEPLTYLTEFKDKKININQDNAYFWINVL